MNSDLDYYNILGVADDATTTEIKKSYRKLAQINHPDKNNGDDTKFKQLSEAKSVLTNKSKREEYDMLRKYGSTNSHFAHDNGMEGIDLHKIYEHILNGGNPREFHSRFRQKQNRSLRIVGAITLEEAYSGMQKNISFNVNNEQKSVIVNIPAGVLDEAEFILQGGGESSIANQPPGDVHVSVRISPHNTFIRQGDHLAVQIKINCFEAIIGSSKEIIILNGKKLEYKIPPGTQHGQRIRLKSQGMPVMNSSYYGDLFIIVDVIIPTNLTSDQKILLNDLIDSK